ncbi:MAG: hypothetical protein ABI823_10415, partial [Bryobacteraceae bacterium]
LCALFATVLLAAGVEKPRVSRASMVAMEKSFDGKVTHLWDDNPFVLLGSTRGVYLDGVGAVFTTEVNLATGPTMFGQVELSKDQVARHKQKKLARLPQIRQAAREMMMSAAASLDGVGADEQIVFCIFLSRYPWEDATGLPSQLQLQAQKKRLLEVQRARGAGLESAIKIVEY